MGLNESEKKLLARLSKKAEEPDAPPVSKSLTAHVDLTDPKSVAAAIKHGFLTDDEAEEMQEGDSEDDSKDETPTRRGYFQEGKK